MNHCKSLLLKQAMDGFLVGLGLPRTGIRLEEIRALNEALSCGEAEPGVGILSIEEFPNIYFDADHLMDWKVSNHS